MSTSVCVGENSIYKKNVLTLLTFFEHSHFEAFHEATGLTRFAPPLRDLTLVCGGTAVFYVS